ncbi:olfactory receptor 6Y1-like [Scleropages formosus]|uniref:Olfactory receptor 6Y1-like n=1 Tax=Scleropages formosus TaxID=113540 RepID=A0A8C9SLA1_SCLFO|nr:olfactory receptor 6Y1-like [Scleropages formosus]
MDNTTFALNILQLEGVDLAPQFVYPVFFILLVTYILTMITNTGLIILIAVERSLHQPMYLLFCNLSFNDIMGNTNILPRMMMDLFSTEKYIGYVECVTQAFCFHTFVAAAHVILMIMAFDRYVAICNPLRYSSVMTTRMVVKLSAYAWAFSLFMVSILLGLTIRLTRCRSVIVNAYCDNASLFKLSCQDVSINNIYGLAYTVFLSSLSLVITIGTYYKIFTICFTKKSKELNNKAIQTCCSHLVLYMIMLWTVFLTFVFHRIQMYSGYRKLVAILFHVVPANLNPVIYALQTKELKSKVKKMLHSKVSNKSR